MTRADFCTEVVQAECGRAKPCPIHNPEPVTVSRVAVDRLAMALDSMQSPNGWSGAVDRAARALVDEVRDA